MSAFRVQMRSWDANSCSVLLRFHDDGTRSASEACYTAAKSFLNGAERIEILGPTVRVVGVDRVPGSDPAATRVLDESDIAKCVTFKRLWPDGAAPVMSTPELNECIGAYYDGDVGYDGKCWLRFLAKADEIRFARKAKP